MSYARLHLSSIQVMSNVLVCYKAFNFRVSSARLLFMLFACIVVSLYHGGASCHFPTS